MRMFMRLFVCAACLAAAFPASAQQPARKSITLGGMQGLVSEQQKQLDDLNKKLGEAETRFAAAMEACRKQAEAAAARTVTVHQSTPAPVSAACDHSDLEKQIKSLQKENDRVKRRIKILETAIRELQLAQKQGERHRERLAKALAAVQQEFPKQIAGLQSAISRLESHTRSVEETVSTLNLQMAEADRVLKKYEPRIAALEARADATDKAVTALERRNNDAFQRRIHLGVEGEVWAVRAGIGYGGGVYLQFPLGEGVCSAIIGGGMGYDSQGLAGTVQGLAKCGRSWGFRFGGIGLFGQSKTVGGTLGVGYSRRFFTIFADGGAGGEKLDGQPFRVTYIAKGGVGLHF
jgi:predicted  nucleic acid-binding Zn-ribbon protein